MGDDYANGRYLIAASGNIFATAKKDSALSMLQGEKSTQSEYVSFKNILSSLLKKTLNEGNDARINSYIESFLDDVLYELNQRNLPPAILCMLAFNGLSHEKLGQYVYVSETDGYKKALCGKNGGDDSRPDKMKRNILSANGMFPSNL